MNEMNYIVVAVLTLGGVALLAAVVLYIVCRAGLPSRKTLASRTCRSVCLVPTVAVVALPDVQPWQKRWSKAPTREVWTDCAVL